MVANGIQLSIYHLLYYMFLRMMSFRASGVKKSATRETDKDYFVLYMYYIRALNIIHENSKMAHHGDDEFDDTLLPTDAELERWRRQYLCSQGEATWEWRAADNIDGILSEPHPHFDLASKAIFRYAHGRTKDAGRYVMYEVPDRMNLDLVWERGISVEYMQRHFLFLPEYLGTVRDRGQGSGVVVIVDMQCSSFLRLSAAFFAGRNMFTEVRILPILELERIAIDALLEAIAREGYMHVLRDCSCLIFRYNRFVLPFSCHFASNYVNLIAGVCKAE